MRVRTALAGLVCAAALAAVAALSVEAARRESPDALLNPGEDCVSCHRSSGKAPRTLFSVSGTVFRAAAGDPRETGAGGVEVVLEDGAGRRVELLSNPAGNFYFRRDVLYPVQVTLRDPAGGAIRRGPPDRCAHGNCNQCHALEQPAEGARGRLVAPGRP